MESTKKSSSRRSKTECDSGRGKRESQAFCGENDVITFRKHLNFAEADRLNRAMDEQASHLDALEYRIREIDAKIQEKKRKNGRSSKARP